MEFFNLKGTLCTQKDKAIRPSDIISLNLTLQWFSHVYKNLSSLIYP